MDGLPSSVLPRELMGVEVRQRTLQASIGCVGVGLHSGAPVRMRLVPAEPGTGIVFRRTDRGGAGVAARFDNVSDTTLCTVLADASDPTLRIGTIEHVMAALAGTGVTNAVIEVDGPEVPILDGSARDIVFLIDCAGTVDQAEPIPMIEVLRPVRVEHGSAFAELRPAAFGFDMTLSIDFDAAAIGRQALTLRMSEDVFRQELAYARTFAERRDIERLRAAGLGRGGSLDNAVVVDGARVLNPTGLRGGDEFVRHKMLDAVGDLALCGAALRGRFVGHCSGHALNNRLLRALFADRSNWRAVTVASPRPWTSLAEAA